MRYSLICFLLLITGVSVAQSDFIASKTPWVLTDSTVSGMDYNVEIILPTKSNYSLESVWVKGQGSVPATMEGKGTKRRVLFSCRISSNETSGGQFNSFMPEDFEGEVLIKVKDKEGEFVEFDITEVKELEAIVKP